jgi:ArsR family transcriptional regulator, arsenate/arsenite/antimonite-responsive transcriptional repressor
MRKLDKILKALADPNRLRILNILLERETCVCEIQPALKLPQPLLSRHLAYLRNAGIVRDRRDGPRVFYSLTLDDEIGQAVREFLQRVFPLCEPFPADSANMRRLACRRPAGAGAKLNKGAHRSSYA